MGRCWERARAGAGNRTDGQTERSPGDVVLLLLHTVQMGRLHVHCNGTTTHKNDMVAAWRKMTLFPWLSAFSEKSWCMFASACVPVCVCGQRYGSPRASLCLSVLEPGFALPPSRACHRMHIWPAPMGSDFTVAEKLLLQYKGFLVGLAYCRHSSHYSAD